MSSRFIQCDRNWQPAALTPDYKTSVARSPRQALVSQRVEENRQVIYRFDIRVQGENETVFFDF